MNLHRIVSGVVAAVNPQIVVVISANAGYTTNQDGSRAPAFNSFSAIAQMQPLTGGDLKKIEGLNLNGTLRAFYFYGEVDPAIRNAIKGGDIITTPDGNEWLVAQSLEQWPDWCKVATVLQTVTVA